MFDEVWNNGNVVWHNHSRRLLDARENGRGMGEMAEVAGKAAGIGSVDTQVSFTLQRWERESREKKLW